MQEEDLDHSALTALQGQRLRALLANILPGNRFYTRKFADAGMKPADVASLDDLRRLPFTTKAEILADQIERQPYGEIHWLPGKQYVRLHQTSGTSGRSLRWLDTTDSWHWPSAARRKCSGLSASNPTIGSSLHSPSAHFWAFGLLSTRLRGSATLSARRRHEQRGRVVADARQPATVVSYTDLCFALAEWRRLKTSTYATPPCALIVAGGFRRQHPPTRERIEQACGRPRFRSHGMTEIGALGIEMSCHAGGSTYKKRTTSLK